MIENSHIEFAKSVVKCAKFWDENLCV